MWFPRRSRLPARPSSILDGAAVCGPARQAYQSTRTPSCTWRGSPRPLCTVPSKLKSSSLDPGLRRFLLLKRLKTSTTGSIVAAPATEAHRARVEPSKSDYAKLLEWRLGPAIARAGGPERLAAMIVSDWKNGDVKRRLMFLADLKWWREEFPKLSKEERERLAGQNATIARDLERLHQSSIVEMIHRLQLQQAYDARQLEILAISNIRARSHELNKEIIRNMGPSGRYEYNPAAGRYDRYVPYR